MTRHEHCTFGHAAARINTAITRGLVGISLLTGWHCQFSSAAESSQPVAAVKVAKESLAQEVTFDAELRPYEEVELHAKVTGYLQALKVEVGDRVTAGQLIGVLEVPELQSDLEHAVAAEGRNQAAAEEAHLAFTRLESAAKAQPGLVAPQDLDAARARDRSAAAALSAAQADVRKFRTLLEYTRITAPFAGVVTKRHANAGALIQAGTSSGAMPLVRLSQNDKLRVVFPVSLSFVTRIREGSSVEILVPSLGKTFPGTVARFTRRVETSTRTMEVEVDLPNPDLSLVPGVYATVILKLDRKENALVIPIEAVTREKHGASVLVVAGGNKLEERNVTLGEETPTKLEVLSGLSEGEVVMLGSRSQVRPGQIVEPKLMQPPRLN